MPRSRSHYPRPKSLALPRLGATRDTVEVACDRVGASMVASNSLGRFTVKPIFRSMHNPTRYRAYDHHLARDGATGDLLTDLSAGHRPDIAGRLPTHPRASYWGVPKSYPSRFLGTPDPRISHVNPLILLTVACPAAKASFAALC